MKPINWESGLERDGAPIGGPAAVITRKELQTMIRAARNEAIEEAWEGVQKLEATNGLTGIAMWYRCRGIIAALLGTFPKGYRKI